MPIGASHAEAVFYFWMPLVISAGLVVLLLVGWRRFFALISALVSFAIYVAIGVASLHNVFGIMMLLFSGWAAVGFLLLAFYFISQGTKRLKAAIGGFIHFLMSNRRYVVLLIAAGIGLLVSRP